MARFDGLKIDLAASDVGLDQYGSWAGTMPSSGHADLNSDEPLFHVCGIRGRHCHSSSISEADLTVAPEKACHIIKNYRTCVEHLGKSLYIFLKSWPQQHLRQKTKDQFIRAKNCRLI